MLQNLFLSLLAPLALTGEINTEVSMKEETEKIIQLPAPDKNVEMTLFEALQNRASSREFSSRELDNKVLSQLLWAASGVNRPEEKKLTAPTAMNRQSVTIYVCKANGAYRWDAYTNSLTLVCTQDVRPAVTNGQGSIGAYPVALVLVADNGKFSEQATSEALQIVSLDAALVCQNINLAATALGLNNVPRVNMDISALKKALELSSTQFPVMNNLVGYRR